MFSGEAIEILKQSKVRSRHVLWILCRPIYSADRAPESQQKEKNASKYEVVVNVGVDIEGGKTM